MVRALLIWLAASAIGIALIALLPERLFGGAVLFRLSDRHGPSVADAIGLAFVFGGWLFYLHALWARRRLMSPRWLALAFVCGAVAGAALCVAAIVSDLDYWALAFGLLAVAFQAAMSFTVRRP